MAKFEIFQLKLYALAIILLLLCKPLHSNSYIDSLKAYVDTAQISDNYLDALLRISYTLAYQNPTQAVHYIHKADSISFLIESELKPHPTIQQYYAIIYTQLSEYDQALNHINESIKLYEKADNLIRAGVSRLQKAMIYNQTRAYDEAHHTLQEAEQIFKENEGQRYLGHVYLELGNTMGNAGDLNKALAYYNQAKETCSANPSTNCLEVALNNVAATYKELKRPKEALEIFEELVIEYEREDPYRKLGIAYQNLADIYYGNFNDPSSSIRYALKALTENLDLNNKAGIAEAYLSLGQGYLSLKDYQEAENYLLQGLTLSQEIEHYQWMSESQKNLALLYERLGNYRMAYTSMTKHKDLRDSIKNSDIRKRISEIETKYETDKKEQEIALLETENDLSRLKLSSQKRIITISLIGVALLGILSVFLYRLFHQNRSQKIELTQAVSDKDYLLREIHHRVKNNLQVISSLLYLQSEKLTDPAAQDALNIGRGRVKSMALIHKNLYGVNQSSEVDLKMYLEDLTLELFDSYNIRDEEIQMNTSIEQMSVDVDTLVPLGLILNELISNALKYAFEGKATGLLSIQAYQEQNKLIIKVDDDGIGITKNASKSNTFGTELIQSFVSQLSAEITRQIEGGTKIKISIPLNEITKS